MNDISGKISLYHSLFLGCLVLTMISFVLSVVLFFALDIRSILEYLTGRLAKKKIQELEIAISMADEKPVWKSYQQFEQEEKTVHLKKTGTFTIVRELMISGFRMLAAKNGKVLAADKSGKIKTFFTDVTIVVMLFDGIVIFFCIAPE